MQEKSLNYKYLLGAALVLLLALLFAFGVNAQESEIPPTPDFRLGIQFSDGRCSAQLGTTKFTDYVSEGGSSSGAAVDADGTDLDCARVMLETQELEQALEANKDIRVCVNVLDGVALDSDGNVAEVTNSTSKVCTPWASEGGGESVWANGVGFPSTGLDGGSIFLEARNLLEGGVVRDVRVGIKATEEGVGAGSCDPNNSTGMKFTPWASDGGGYSGWATDTEGTDPSCLQVSLEAKTNICFVENPNKPKVLYDEDDIEFIQIDNTGTGIKSCPDGYVFTWFDFDDDDDRHLLNGKCNRTENLFAEEQTPRRMLMTAEKGDYICRDNEVMTGILYHDGGSSGFGYAGGDDGAREVVCGDVRPNTVKGGYLDGIAGCPGGYCTSAGANQEFAQGINNNQTPQRNARGFWWYETNQSNSDFPPTPEICDVPPDEPACDDGYDNDGDGFIDFPNDPQCISPEDESEGGEEALDPDDADVVETYSCNFNAEPTTIVKGIGTSELSWSCESDLSGAVGSVSASINYDGSQIFEALDGALPAQGSAKVAPEQTTTFTLNYLDSSPEVVVVKVTTSSFDEEIPF